jgi:nickel-dependent lactate racemase
MIVRLPYGKAELEVDLADDLDVTIIEQPPVPGLDDPPQALRDALRNPIGSEPLSNLVGPDDKVGIVFSDITRPTPNHIILPCILEELRRSPRENITLFNALGTHRRNTPEELRDLLGDDLVDSYRIVQNDAFDPSSQTHLGRTSRGNDVWINRELTECDVKVLTGFIEPHFFAGFSGGGKAVMPGMAGQQTVLKNHAARMIRHPKAVWGMTWGNPVWEEIREVACGIDRTFLVNVSLNRDKRITGIFVGDLDAAYAAGTDFVRKTAMMPVPHAFDIVVTSNSGYPLDLNLYQSVKGMSAAAQIVREGGAIILAASCWDGIPEHGLYAQLLQDADSPQALLDTICAPGFLKQDQWQAQLQAQIQLKADVYVRTDNLTDEQIEMALLKPCGSIEATIAKLLRKHGAEARICVLPEGPLTVPYIQS